MQIKRWDNAGQVALDAGGRAWQVELTHITAMLDDAGNVTRVEMPGSLKDHEMDPVIKNVADGAVPNVAKGFVDFNQKHLFNVSLQFSDPVPENPDKIEEIKNTLLDVLKSKLADL